MPNLFDKPTIPKNSLQLLQWLIFEPILLKQYEKTLDKTQTVITALKAVIVNFFIVIIPLTLVFYAISVVIIAAFDLPLIFPPNQLTGIDANVVLIPQWQTFSTIWEKVYFFISFENYRSLIFLVFGFAIGLAIGLFRGLTGSLAGGLTAGLTGGLAISLAFALAISLTAGLAISVAFGLGGGLAAGSALSLTAGLAFRIVGLIFGSLVFLILVLIGGLYIALTFTLTYAITFPVFFCLGYFHLWLYPWHFFRSLFRVSLIDNPYINNGRIFLPIWGMTRQLTTQAQHDPKTGLAFVNFLQTYRPRQKELAMHIAHAATAGNWQHHPLQKQYLLPPPLIQETPCLTPSELWLSQIDKLKNQFIADNEEETISLKQIETFYEQLQEFKDLTLNESERWHHYYLPAIEGWLTAATERRAQLVQNV